MQSSFLGRTSGTASALLAKSSSNFGNAKSFIFGSENRSNQGATANGSQAQVRLLKAFYSFLLSWKCACYSRKLQRSVCLSFRQATANA